MMDITKPMLVINEQVCKANIKRMADKCKALGLEFRPHFKTHQSHHIGRWFHEQGVKGITVSSLGMANYFADDGWKDITVAFPCNIRQIKEINQLADKINLTVLVDDEAAINELADQLTSDLNLFIEIDSGGNRSGVLADNVAKTLEMASLIANSNKLNFKGIYSHAGQTYGSNDKSQIIATSNESIEKLNVLFDEVVRNYPGASFCYGDTPSCSVRAEFGKATALSPGNFVFYDVMQTEIGSCKMEDIAIALFAPIVGVKPDRGELIVYSGAIHLSKDRSNHFGFGAVVRKSEKDIELLNGAIVSRLSQEHGIISLPDQYAGDFKIGDEIGIIPIHSCLTAECMGQYLSDDGSFIDHYKQKKHI